MVPSLAIDAAAMLEKKKCSKKTVDRTCTTGTPDQLRTCSPSQCCCCCGDSVILVRVICDTVICEILTRISKSDISLAAAAARAVAWRYGCETLMPKYIRLKPFTARTT